MGREYGPGQSTGPEIMRLARITQKAVNLVLERVTYAEGGVVRTFVVTEAVWLEDYIRLKISLSLSPSPNFIRLNLVQSNFLPAENRFSQS